MPDEPTKKSRKRKIEGEPEAGRPGHNGGGWLKTGNTVNVGRKPSDVRTDILNTVGDATALMRSILDGEFKQPVRDMFGNVVGYRPATITEVATVYKALVGHALPVKTEMSGPEGGPIPVSNVSNAELLDKLSPEDFAAMEAISKRVHGTPNAE